MDPVAVDWLPSLLVLAAGLAAGVFLVWHFTRRGRPAATASAAPPVEERDLLAKRDALLAQLRELLDTAAKRDPGQLARERYALELAAAQVLRDLDRRAALAPAEEAKTESAPSAEPEPATAGNPALRGFLWASGAMLVIGGLVYLVSQQATSRPEGASVTGNTPGMAPAAGAVDPEEARAKALLAANPEDLGARLDLARVYLGRQDMMGVWNETQLVLAKDPNNPQALSYQALVRLAMGQSDLALDMMKRALAAAPDFLDGYVHIALVYVRTGKPKEAEAAIAEATRRFPDQKAMLQRVLAEMKAQTPAEPGSPATGEANPHATIPAPGEPNPHAAVPAPGDLAASGQAAAGPRAGARPADLVPAATPNDGPTISGSIEMDPALEGQVPPGAVIYVMARPAGVPAGSPLAVVRLAANRFPLSFEIGSRDSMTGGALPEAVLLEARLDDDGDAATRTPNDPKAKLEGVKLGTKGVNLVLKRGQ